MGFGCSWCGEVRWARWSRQVPPGAFSVTLHTAVKETQRVKRAGRKHVPEGLEVFPVGSSRSAPSPCSPRTGRVATTLPPEPPPAPSTWSSRTATRAPSRTPWPTWARSPWPSTPPSPPSSCIGQVGPSAWRSSSRSHGSFCTSGLEVGWKTAIWGLAPG